jgi:hypothetical protein
MSPKKSAAEAAFTTAAQQGLEDLNEIMETSGSGAQLTSAAELAADDEMETTGGGGPRAEIFFSHEAYEGMKDTDRLIGENDTFDGEYVGSFVSGQYDSRKHKIRISGGTYGKSLNGKVIALPTAGKLDKKFQFVPSGTRTIVTYEGRATKADVGPLWKGQLPFRYEVALPKKVNRAIEAGTLTANYEIKKKDS